tara:strand:- start:545 stop:913 length:369 start_codon:yes stop_codon:yes gene_type:complete
MILKISTNYLLLSSMLLISVQLDASEKEVNRKWCSAVNGETEFRTKYGTYVDCLTSIYSVEAEYDYNWKEGIGQSLHYSEATGKSAAILFIIREESKKDYLDELKKTIKFHNLKIKIFVINE